MAQTYGATPLDTALSRLDTTQPAPFSHKSGFTDLHKTDFDQIARATRVPANVLIALDGGRGDTGKAAANARFLAQAVEGGSKINDAVTALVGNEAAGQSVIANSYKIGAALYPLKTEPKAKDPQGSNLAGDLGKLAASGAVGGTGSAVYGLGAFADNIVQGFRGTADQPGESRFRSGSRWLADQIKSGGDYIGDSVSDEMATALKGTQPGGNLLDPSTWTLGENPSLRGVLGVGAKGIGSMAPVVLAGGPRAAAAIGGLMGGGEGAKSGRQFVLAAAAAADEHGRPEIEKLPEYQKLRETGADHDQATSILAQRAEAEAGFRQAIPAMLGGAATNRIMRSADGWLGRGGRLSRAGKKAATGAAEEGLQEAVEGAAGRSGINTATGANMDIAGQSFGDFFGGALAGGGLGAIAGAVSSPSAQSVSPPDTLPPDPVPGASLALPAPDPVPDTSLVSAPRLIGKDTNVDNHNPAFAQNHNSRFAQNNKGLS